MYTFDHMHLHQITVHPIQENFNVYDGSTFLITEKQPKQSSSKMINIIYNL
jgi:hypothetical protein